MRSCATRKAASTPILDKVHRLDHKGEFFRSRGPFTVPRSPQGHPVVIQAGQSKRGKEFSARWGEVVFVGTPHTLESGQRAYAEFKKQIEANGRDPEKVTLTPSLYTVVADTKAEAEDKMALNEKLFEEVDALSLLSEAMNFDFASKDMDEPFTDEELDNISGTQSMRDRVVEASGIHNPTVRDFIKYSSRARPRNPFVGGPKEVADKMEAHFVGRACDGFVLAADNIPGSYEDFVAAHRAGAAAPGALSQGLQGCDATRESWAASSRARRLEALEWGKAMNAGTD